MDNTPSNKKIAVISGGAGYLGSAIARKLAGNGFTVVAITKTNKTATDIIKNEFINYVTADITDTESIKKIAEEVKNRFGKVSAVIHAASAPLVREPLLSQSLKDFQSQLSVNIVGAFNLFKSFYPIILPGGTIIGITSKAADTGAAHSPSGSYIPAKYALRGLLRVLSSELKEQSILVCGVAPAFMPGGLNRDIPKAVVEFIKKKSSPEEITSPEEVAEVIFDIINDKVADMNGKSIAIPGRALTDL
ncbi:MAG: SDR family oxidoreductase [Candidatus Azambacteria bacterium]|nr:SDR family oxidoreductase [Candidatus Azambacteria bacterium]